MADGFEEEAEPTVSIQEYLKDVEDQELVASSFCIESLFFNFFVACGCFMFSLFELLSFSVCLLRKCWKNESTKLRNVFPFCATKKGVCGIGTV